MKCGNCSFENPPNSQYCSRCGARFEVPAAAYATTITVHPPQVELAIGSIFAGRYQVIEELGRGGMGRVYKVLDREINERIALKLLKPEISADENIIERFRNELKLARKISHENVCRMYDLNNHEGVYFITMEYVSGEDLKGTIARLGQLSEGKILFIASQICKGLGAAHRLGVVHRDLKPHNIMIDRHGDVRIMDFGIARSISSSGITESGVMIGTPEYMSPEQAMGEDVDQRADIYSLGIILFELTTGTVPFKGDTAVSIALKQKTEPPPSPRKLCPQISEELSRLILKCIEKNREKRYRNVDEVLEELANLKKGLPTTDKIVPESRTAETLSQKARRPFLKIAFPILASLLVLASGFVIYKLMRGKGETSRAQTTPPQDIQLKPVEPLQTGSLQITSIPDGAEVFIDDDEMPKGKTPIEGLSLATGLYTIKLRHPDYPEYKDEVTITADKTESKEYVLSTYVLSVTSEPDGARVWINDKFYRTTPLLNIPLTEKDKSCRIKVDKGQGLSDERTVTLEPGAPRSEHFVLEKRMYVLKINTFPPDAIIYLGGKPNKELPKGQSLPYGTYTINIEKEGYESKELKIRLNSDKTEKISLIKLEEVKLIVNANSPSIVFVDGKEIGEVPFPKEVSVTVGTHTIEFESKKLNRKTTKTFEAKKGLNIDIRYYVEKDDVVIHYSDK